MFDVQTAEEWFEAQDERPSFAVDEKVHLSFGRTGVIGNIVELTDDRVVLELTAYTTGQLVIEPKRVQGETRFLSKLH